LLQEQGIEEAIQRRELKRQAAWSEALVVGNQQFVERVPSLFIPFEHDGAEAVDLRLGETK